MLWKFLYGKSSGDHGTLDFFRSHLHRAAVTTNPKKDVNACVDLICTVSKGHILHISGLDDHPIIPPGLKEAGKPEQLAFINDISQVVVDKCTLINTAFSNLTTVSFEEDEDEENEDGVYNYARVLCHFGALIMEFRDAWGEGDGGRVVRCWKLFMPHFIAAGHTKYALDALRLQMQVNATLSPNLAHQVMWNRFVNTRGGLGRNIPGDLHNEHVNKLMKHIIVNMGPNLTATALQRAARSVTALEAISESFDRQSGVPHRTSAHTTKADVQDVKKVMETVKKNKLLTLIGNREHRNFPWFSTQPSIQVECRENKVVDPREKGGVLEVPGEVQNMTTQ